MSLEVIWWIFNKYLPNKNMILKPWASMTLLYLIINWMFSFGSEFSGTLCLEFNEINFLSPSVFLSQWLNCPVNSLGHSSGGLFLLFPFSYLAACIESVLINCIFFLAGLVRFEPLSMTRILFQVLSIHSLPEITIWIILLVSSSSDHTPNKLVFCWRCL